LAAQGGRRGFADKAALLAGGSAVAALTYERASADKKKQSKSVTDQRRLNHAEVAGHGWRLAESFMDNDRSASRHAKKARPDFERLIEAIESGRGDVLVMWEMARGQRDLAVYVQIRDLCIRAGLFFWSLGGAIYDLRARVDRMSLSFQAVQSEDQAEYIRDNVLRGVEGAALSGRPPGALAYGYSRLYDQKTRALLTQTPDLEPREATAEDGTVSEYTPADVVVEIFTRISKAHSLTSIARDLNRRGIASP
jgi:DNA invertase Pin-like site-specific DNA recombinase